MKRALLLGMLLLSVRAVATAATCPSGLFIQAESVPSGGQSALVAIAPIDGDASLDIVTVNQYEGSVSVLPGNGDGTFGAPIVTAISFSGLYSMAVGDLNGDTKADLVIGTYYEVLVLLGHGDGTFDAPVEYPANIGPITGISLGKLDANASLDIAAVSNGSIVVMLGNGDGTFASGVKYPAIGATSLTSGDFNGDGHLDLAVAAGSSVVVWLGVGDGTLGPPNAFVAGSNLLGIAASDLNGDGHVDLIVGSGTLVSVLLGNGNGTFQAALQYASGISIGLIAIADLDLDGVPDVLVAAQSSPYGGIGGVAVLRGSGDGSLAAGATYSTGVSSAGLAVGDLDADGLPDAVIGNPNDHSVTIFIDTPGGVLYAAPVSAIPQGPGSSIFVHADFDEDGRQDFGWVENNSVAIILGSPRGRFRSGPTIVDPNQQQLFGIGAGDFGFNHHADLVIADYSSVWIFPGNGDGSFGSPQDLFDSFSLGGIQVADFDGDGRPDIAFTQGCCGPSTNVIVLLGNGDGSFRPPLQTSLNTDARILLAADLNGDGHTDLVASSSTGALLVPGNGDGTFATPVLLEAGQTFSFAAAGDFDANGHADLLLTRGAPSVDLLLADGSGGFHPPTVIGVGGVAGPLAVADFDGDGKLDFAVATGSVLVLRGLGNGHFQTPLIFPTDSTPAFIATGDYDGNGKPDLASVGSQTITTFLNAQLGASVPLSASVIVGGPATFSSSAGGGFGPITYQWRKNGAPLSDGGPISGSHTATLTIDPVVFTDAGSYDVVVTDSCTNATSNASTLSVEFDDVPLSNPFHADIIKIATAGITTGCTATSYCPSASVSRAEMAVFLLKAKFGAGHVPPPPPPVPIFADVPAGAFAAAWIDELATLGITGGCGNGNYCPDDPVTRGQMAVFLLKTLLGSGYSPPTATGIFADVPPNYFAIDWIEDLYARGITAGCNTNPLRYCPDQAIPREQMAAFLVRTFSIP